MNVSAILTADELDKRRQAQDLQPREIVVQAGDLIRVRRKEVRLDRDPRSNEDEEIIRVVER